MHDEKKLIRLAMITLFLSLMIVYMLLYQVKWDKLKVVTSTKSWNDKVSIVPKTWTISEVMRVDNKTWSLVISGNANSGTKIIAPIKSNSWTKAIVVKTWSTIGTKIKMLSWTYIYYGWSDSLDKLWIKYQYALRDTKDIHYFNLWNPTYDFKSIARSLWWDTFTLITEQDIFQNKLFWGKVIFINLPENKDKLVLMVIYVNNEVWMIEISYDIYHKSKEYIKSLFID